ncbi:MAG: hypothetical protein J0G95_07975 [Rhizobiales bacterium]|nr:hypothetical protein [Hyphomicrobiales bacterium]
MVHSETQEISAGRRPGQSPIAVTDLFRIGIEPSSSHTVCPMRAAVRFVEELTARQAKFDKVTVGTAFS